MWDELLVVEVDQPLMVRAGDLAERERLRGYDAVQLAAACASDCDLLVCADRALCAAGARQGLTVLDLN